MIRGAIDLPLKNGVIEVSGLGVVTIKQGLTAQRMPLITAHPFAQPQPYFVLDDDTRFTTDGARLLHQVCMETQDPARVIAGYDLLAALLISPEGFVLADLATDVLVARRLSQGPRTQHHTYRIEADRFGLKSDSAIEFHEGVLDSITVEPLHASSNGGWGESYR